MKKFFAVVFAVLLVLSLCACAPATPDTPDNPDTPDTPDNPDTPVHTCESVCPECGKPTKKMTSKKGKIFYGCSAYPDCKFMSWDMPTGKKCPECGAYLVSVNGKVKCSSKSCKYTEDDNKNAKS